MRFLFCFLLLACSSKPVNAEPESAPEAAVLSCEFHILAADPEPEFGKPCDAVLVPPGRFFKKEAAGWGEPVVITGQAGPKGDPGPKGDQGSPGEGGGLEPADRQTLDKMQAEGAVCCHEGDIASGGTGETVYGPRIDLEWSHMFLHARDDAGPCPIR